MQLIKKEKLKNIRVVDEVHLRIALAMLNLDRQNFSNILEAEKTILVHFTYDTIQYEIVIYKVKGEWESSPILHKGECNLCKSKTKTCHTLNLQKEELFSVIKPSIRLRMLFE